MKITHKPQLKIAVKVFFGIMSAVPASHLATAGGFSWEGNEQTKVTASFNANEQSPQAKATIVKNVIKGKVLVVLSSENKITLKGDVVHPTGFFFSELMVPAKKLLDAGYELVFANPNGSKAVMDKISDSPFWFGDTPDATAEAKSQAERKYRETKDLCKQLGVCGDGSLGTKNVKSFIQIIGEGLDRYTGIFVPGGHAPMEDLWKNRELGMILRYFHTTTKPTALICHGPIALLSTLNDPEDYIATLETQLRDREVGMFWDGYLLDSKTKGWIYRGYRLTVFTTNEEKQEEPGQDDALGGFVKFYPDEALMYANAFLWNENKWHSNVIQDRELITAQNPMSDEVFADALVKALDARTTMK